MNKILFRAKRADNGVWEYGYYACVGPVGNEKHYIIPSYASDFYGVEIDPDTIGQYIPLVDAYVGDILHGHERDEHGHLLSQWSGVVKYNDELGRYMIEDECGCWYEVDDYDFDEVQL